MTDHTKLTTDQMDRMSVDDFKRSRKLPLAVVLDNVRSLHNIGSIFRTSDAFRIQCIYLCGISSTPPNADIHKSALGAENSVDWIYFEETSQAVEALKKEDYTIVSIEQTRNSIPLEEFQPEENRKYALVFGHEVKGVSQDIVNQSEMTVEIPQFGTKHSFNVSVTAGIVLWEMFRKMSIQRKF